MTAVARLRTAYLASRLPLTLTQIRMTLGRGFTEDDVYDCFDANLLTVEQADQLIAWRAANQATTTGAGQRGGRA